MADTTIHISGEAQKVAWCRDGRLFSNVAGPWVVAAVPSGRIVDEGTGPVDQLVSYALQPGEHAFHVEA